MTDYFNDFSTLTTPGLPSPADTPYETPGFIRSKRSTRVTGGSSREESPSPPPLPPDNYALQDRPRDGRYAAVDPRRFTPTLHASLVSEILNLRRELDSKNNLVENLEVSLSTAKQENDALSDKLASSAKEVRIAKRQVQQMEKGTFDVVEELARDRDAARNAVEEMKSKLETAQKTTRRQDDDALRTQRIWESEKENWEKERRQLERRVHITESRLRTFVDEMAAHQASTDSHKVEVQDLSEESWFKDSGIGNDSDTASVPSAAASPIAHRPDSSISHRSRRSRILRNSFIDRNADTPELAKAGFSLADELGIDEEDEYDLDEFEHADDDLDYPERADHVRRTIESRQSNGGDIDSKAKRVLGFNTEGGDQQFGPPLTKSQPDGQEIKEARKQSIGRLSILGFGKKDSPTSSETPPVLYVDSGYQPSPPPSPPQKALDSERTPELIVPPPELLLDSSALEDVRSQTDETLRLRVATPISPPETPIIDQATWAEEDKSATSTKPTYSTSSTQTDEIQTIRPKTPEPSRKSLEQRGSPSLVPSIAIHPPTSRPSTPLSYVLPPRTKNASTQANITQPWSSCNAGVQTEEIRVDRRAIKLPPHLMPAYLLPSPTLHEPTDSTNAATRRMSELFTKATPPDSSPPPIPMPAASSPPPQSPPAERPSLSRDDSQKDLRSMPFRVIPLPRPILSPVVSQSEISKDGPLNRSAQSGVTKPSQSSSNQLMDVDKDSDYSDQDDFTAGIGIKNLVSMIPGINKPLGRLGQVEPPKAVPEDKEISPERRPATAGSTSAAPAPFIASSRANSRQAFGKQPVKSGQHKSGRSRSPSLGSMASSSYSANYPILPFHPGVPPFPIPTRSSSRIIPMSYSDGSRSPTRYHSGSYRSQRTHHNRQASLRKVQSAAAIRHGSRRTSPPKSRRRRHSPDLTPVQSMAFESPAPANFPLAGASSGKLLDTLPDESVKHSVDTAGPPTTSGSVTPKFPPEANLVDAIAATMVGEWMWKYIRKRKSFGVGEDFPLGEDGGLNNSTHGSRHKRWVWLSPYERCIMWDSKQPASGNALLGKKGRKLAITSVMDVQDETPLPRNPELASAFNRSILILTPQRALKFTAVSHERHLLWMTALSFLAESGHSPMPLTLEPPAPEPSLDSVPIKRYRSPSFGRAQVRDSIRLAKGKRPPVPKKFASQEPIMARSHPVSNAAQEPDGADFPAIPRLPISSTRHQRKRSNTSPRVAGIRNASSSTAAAVATALSSSSSILQNAASKTRSSTRESLPSSAELQMQPNFFEAVGTVRMSAFVDPSVRDGVQYVPGPPPSMQTGFPFGLGAGAAPSRGAGASSMAPPLRRRRGDSSLSQATSDKRRAGYVFDDFGSDPFGGF